MKHLFLFMLVFGLAGMLVAASAVTNSYNASAVTFSVSNQTAGAVYSWKTPIPVTNIYVECSAGEVWVETNPLGWNFDLAGTASVFTEWTRLAVSNSVVFPKAQDYIRLKTTNAANNTVSIHLR